MVKAMLPGCGSKDTHVNSRPEHAFQKYIFCLKYRAFQFCKNCLVVCTVLKRFLMKPCYVFAFSLCLTSALSAETKPTYNMYGTLGMIDMPSAEMTSDVYRLRTSDFVVANLAPAAAAALLIYALYPTIKILPWPWGTTPMPLIHWPRLR